MDSQKVLLFGGDGGRLFFRLLLRGLFVGGVGGFLFAVSGDQRDLLRQLRLLLRLVALLEEGEPAPADEGDEEPAEE